MTEVTKFEVPTSDEIPTLTFDQLTEHLRLSRVNIGHYQEVREQLLSELASRSATVNYKCMKCQHSVFEISELRASQSGLSSIFNVETARYQAVVCVRCKFTEFYQGSVPIGQQALDFLLSG